ncbi:hypothetical protein [Glycocaulis sp.]|uniref:hypothetical protein n=1 Tax=Glycocaulis sp. TaxID=1969725 RepID=UPI003FA0A543
MFGELKAKDAQRQKQQGLGKPIISVEARNHRIVAVGNRIYHSSRWKTFHDFLREYIFILLGPEWVESESKKPPADSHPIIQWYSQAMRDARAMPVGDTGLFTGAMTGAQRAFLNLAYNLYLIAHHSDPEKAKRIIDSFVLRLKSARADDFIGKLFETYASAAFLKAGFQIEYENERDGGDSHVEFVATYPETSKKFSVEVKARNPLPGSESAKDNKKHPNIWHKIKKALKKTAAHERVVFIEVNVSEVVGPDFSGTWADAALDQMEKAEEYVDREGVPYPPAYVIITNHAYHNNLEASDVGIQAISAGYKIPDFGPRASIDRFKKYLENLERHREMFALFDSLKEHSHIPATFDGEIPDFAFSNDTSFPRLRIGQQYLVPDESGVERLATLEQAVVSESAKKAMCVYRLEDHRRIVASNELTEREISAWKQHPETFFGQLEEKPSKPQNWLELAEFFYRTYKNSSKEKLLEFMKGHDDLDRLADMEQNELAIIYCERLGLAAWGRAEMKADNDASKHEA